MDNYNNGYNNDSWNNPQGNGPDSQQNNYSAQDYQQPYGANNNQGYQQPYGANNNQGYQQQNAQDYQQPYGAQDYQQPYGSQPDYYNQNNYNQNNYQQYQQYPNYNQYQVEDTSAKNMGTASMVLGIVSFFCCGLPCSIVGLILGIISKKRQPENNAKATAGIVLSIIALVLWGVFFVIGFIGGSASYSFG